MSQDNHLPVDSRAISLRSHVKSVGVYIDAILSMAKHIDHSSRSAYLEIRRISWIRHLQTRAATARLMCSFDLSRLDFCIFFFYSLIFFSDQMRRLQRHQTHTAKVGFFGFFFRKKNKHENVRPLLEKIRWLPFKDMIFFFFFLKISFEH